MRDANKLKIYSAVKECLAECYGTANPLTHAAHFLEVLRNRSGWTAAEVTEVESFVLRAITIIVRQPRSDCCHDGRS